MKRIFTAVLIVVGCYYASAQTNIFPSSGRVGIGTTNPLTLLDVQLTTNEHVQFIQDLNGSAAGFSGITCINDNNSAYTPLGFLASKYYFNVGNVGIGTAAPAHLLTLNNSTSGGTYLGLYQSYTDGNNWRNWVIGSNYYTFGDFALIQSNATGGNPLSAGTNRFYINPSGNIGIGTTSRPICLMQMV